MAFSLGLSSCQNGNCKHLVLTDTSCDSSVTPSTTWNGVGNPSMSNITQATLEITMASDTSVSYVLNVVGFFIYDYIGRASGVLGGTILTGVNTTFTTDVSPGDVVTVDDITNYTVASVDSDTQLTLTSALVADVTNDWLFNTSVTPYDPLNLIYDIISDDLGLSTDLALPDDVYNIVYSVYDDGAHVWYTLETNVLLYCTVECCVYTKIQAIPSYYGCDNCDSTHITDALTSFSFLLALESAARCGPADDALNILNTLKRLCNYQPCVGCK